MMDKDAMVQVRELTPQEVLAELFEDEPGWAPEMSSKLAEVTIQRLLDSGFKIVDYVEPDNSKGYYDCLQCRDGQSLCTCGGPQHE